MATYGWANIGRLALYNFLLLFQLAATNICGDDNLVKIMRLKLARRKLREEVMAALKRTAEQAVTTPPAL